jgi:hypothetical protein
MAISKKNKTNDGLKGGLLEGKPHYDKNGKSLGGIKAIVTDTDQIVELEGGEVIINKEASKKHWKTLSKINQSAGGGVPILPPDEVLADTEEYKLGGRTIEFNPNNLPSKWIMAYATRIKKDYPEIWKLGGNEYGNEAFVNLDRVLKRGYWLDGEEWFYVKWQSFNARHKGDFLIAGVVANLKWANKVEKGWDYMKDLIEAEIKKRGLKKMKTGGELEKGIEVEKEHADTIQKIYDHKITPEEAPKQIALDHLEEMDDYYTKLAQMEGMREGGKVAKVMREFKEGKLHSSSGDLVTNPKQAIAIALSEQRRYEQLMDIGGRIECSHCGHSWHKHENHSTNVNVCHKCGNDNRYPFEEKIKEKVNFNKIEIDMRKSDLFYNNEIYKNYQDYVLGGFNVDKLNDIETPQYNNSLSVIKVKTIIQDRIERLIDSYKKQIRENFINDNPMADEETADNEVNATIKRLFETYLSKKIYSFSTEDILYAITQDETYVSWFSGIEQRIIAYNSVPTRRNENIVSKTQGSIPVEEAEDITYNATLETLLEQLSNSII